LSILLDNSVRQINDVSMTGDHAIERAARRLRQRPPIGASGVTLWRRIADDLERSIAGGTPAAGERLPGEIEIAARFGVNRHTVRRALAELSARGLIRAERGSGTFVEAERLRYPIGARTRFSEIVGTAGRGPEGRLIAHWRESAASELSQRLGIAPGETVIGLEILRSADRVPISCATTWLPAARAPDAARIFRAARSITGLLAHYGIGDYRRRSTRVSAATAEAIDAERLRLAPGRAVLVVDSIDVTPDGTPILTTRARFAADRIELLVES
jgi:GntR family phosphonate transport system transcriptional regulator